MIHDTSWFSSWAFDDFCSVWVSRSFCFILNHFSAFWLSPSLSREKSLATSVKRSAMWIFSLHLYVSSFSWLGCRGCWAWFLELVTEIPVPQSEFSKRIRLWARYELALPKEDSFLFFIFYFFYWLEDNLITCPCLFVHGFLEQFSEVLQLQPL